jgi:exopolyphosphatase / guanosine-5'-triphosphate,3'-diphosphate pyrophosphatase
MSEPSFFPVDPGEAALLPAGASANGRVAVVDIGSNSVRLVVFDGASRTAFTVHNEKTICSIGRELGTTGLLYSEGVALALQSLRRYRHLADRLGVVAREAVATAAARDARNGADFVRRATAAWGASVRVLSGVEEAQLAGEGVLAAIPDADGAVADLGGGSLDMVTVKFGRTAAAVSLPFGPLRLADMSRSNLERARKLVDEALSSWAPLGGLEGKTLYLVGGIWRSIARVDMLREAYPLHLLQSYTIPAARAAELCGVLAKQGKKSLELLTVVSKRRVELLPYGAVVLQRLLATAHFKDVVVSANGVREGLLFSRLSPEERAKDPLVEYAMAENRRLARVPAHAPELFEWAAPLFGDEGAAVRRLRLAFCHFSDIGWRRHPDHRARGTYEDVLAMPFGGADHRTRAFLAAAVFHRYAGTQQMLPEPRLRGLITKDDERRALRIGLAARLAFALSAAAAGELAQYRLRLTPAKLILEVPGRRSAVADDAVARRMGALGEAFDRTAEIQVIGG